MRRDIKKRRKKCAKNAIKILHVIFGVFILCNQGKYRLMSIQMQIYRYFIIIFNYFYASFGLATQLKKMSF